MEWEVDMDIERALRVEPVLPLYKRTNGTALRKLVLGALSWLEPLQYADNKE